MSGLRRALERRWPSAARSDPMACERGFTALELITVLAILAVVFTIVTSLFISFNQQTTNTQDSVVGIQEETQAQQTLIQYLRGASQLLPAYNSYGTQVGPSSTELDAITSEGFNMSTYNSNYEPRCSLVQAGRRRARRRTVRHHLRRARVRSERPAVVVAHPGRRAGSVHSGVELYTGIADTSNGCDLFRPEFPDQPGLHVLLVGQLGSDGAPGPDSCSPSMCDQRGRGCRHPHHVPRGTPGPDRRLCRRRADDFGHDCLPSGLGDGDHDHRAHDHHHDDRTLPKLRR